MSGHFLKTRDKLEKIIFLSSSVSAMETLLCICTTRDLACSATWCAVEGNSTRLCVGTSSRGHDTSGVTGGAMASHRSLNAAWLHLKCQSQSSTANSLFKSSTKNPSYSTWPLPHGQALNMNFQLLPSSCIQYCQGNRCLCDEKPFPNGPAVV